jgi:hypothetical protein
MSGRKCGNCRHYEPAPIWRSGWCRNPRLYGPQESHLVRQDELACAHRIGNYWEAVEDDADGPGDRPGFGARPLGGIVKPLRLFGPGPRMLAATSGSSGGGRFGSGGSGSGSSGSAGGSEPLSSSGAGRDPYGTGGAGGGRPPQTGYGGTGPGRPDPTGRLPGQERSVSYQPEERYWTDYLRIALPVVGLLLMLGLFWFWAANLIADDDDDEPPATLDVANVPTATVPAAAVGTETPAAGPTETAPPPAEDETAPPDDEETAPPDEQADAPPPDDEDEEPPPDDGGEEPADDSQFPVGSFVIVNTEDLNFRPEPNTTTDPIRALANGEELEVRGPIETDSNGQEWLPVTDENGEQGYVAVEWVVPA